MSDETRKLLAELLSQDDTYQTVGKALSGFNYVPQKSGDEGRALGLALGQALVTGALGGLSSRRKAAEQRQIAALLPELQSNPYGVSAPEGLDPEIFSALQQDAVLSQIAEQKAAKEEERKFGLKLKEIAFGKGIDRQAAVESALISTLLNDPIEARKAGDDPSYIGRLLEDAFSQRPQGRTAALPSGSDVVAEVTRSADPFEEAIGNVAADPLSAVMEESEPVIEAEEVKPKAKTISGLYSEAFNRNLEETRDRTAARSFAEKTVSKFQNQKEEYLKKVSELNQKSVDVFTLLSGADKGAEDAKLTGLPAQASIDLVARSISALTGGWNSEFLTDRNAIKMLESATTTLFRTPGEGVISDADREFFFTGLPSTNKGPEENKQALERLRRIMDLNSQYAAILDRAATSDEIVDVTSEIAKLRAQASGIIRGGDGTGASASSGMDMSQFSGLSRQEALRKAKEMGLVR
jgi:hypothetical protein